MTQVKSQLLGLMLGLATAIGCMMYEKLVHNFSYGTLWLICVIDLFIFRALGFLVFESSIKEDFAKLITEPKYWIIFIIYILTGITGMLWYKITKDSSIMVSSIYEVKYIVILALLYIIFGDQKFTINTMMGVGFALCSIYFISKK